SLPPSPMWYCILSNDLAHAEITSSAQLCCVHTFSRHPDTLSSKFLISVIQWLEECVISRDTRKVNSQLLLGTCMNIAKNTCIRDKNRNINVGLSTICAIRMCHALIQGGQSVCLACHFNDLSLPSPGQFGHSFMSATQTIASAFAASAGSSFNTTLHRTFSESSTFGDESSDINASRVDLKINLDESFTNIIPLTFNFEYMSPINVLSDVFSILLKGLSNVGYILVSAPILLSSLLGCIHLLEGEGKGASHIRVAISEASDLIPSVPDAIRMLAENTIHSVSIRREKEYVGRTIRSSNELTGDKFSENKEQQENEDRIQEGFSQTTRHIEELAETILSYVNPTNNKNIPAYAALLYTLMDLKILPPSKVSVMNNGQMVRFVYTCLSLYSHIPHACAPLLGCVGLLIHKTSKYSDLEFAAERLPSFLRNNVLNYAISYLPLSHSLMNLLQEVTPLFTSDKQVSAYLCECLLELCVGVIGSECLSERMYIIKDNETNKNLLHQWEERKVNKGDLKEGSLEAVMNRLNSAAASLSTLITDIKEGRGESMLHAHRTKAVNSLIVCGELCEVLEERLGEEYSRKAMKGAKSATALLEEIFPSDGNNPISSSFIALGVSEEPEEPKVDLSTIMKDNRNEKDVGDEQTNLTTSQSETATFIKESKNDYKLELLKEMIKFTKDVTNDSESDSPENISVWTSPLELYLMAPLNSMTIDSAFSTMIHISEASVSSVHRNLLFSCIKEGESVIDSFKKMWEIEEERKKKGWRSKHIADDKGV
ncbi:hypothetical protein ADUPG1_007116, partial [Aduncisulcus paluster]